VIAATLGLLSEAFHALENAASASHQVPHFVTRTFYVLGFITGPGVLLGSLLTSLVAGFSPISNHRLDQLEEVVGLAVSVAAFGSL
jgi:hypothetical protein